MVKTKIYQIRIWCCDDGCSEFWFDKELSPFYLNRVDAEKALKKYENKTSSQLAKMCDVLYVGVNKPIIQEFDLIQ